MARSPFQGTFQPNARPTVVTAPDALVYINGETDIIGCPSCKRRFDYNKYITSIQVDLSTDSSPGSASIALAVPRHSIDDFYFDGNPVVTTMMEVEIYAKGYYLLEGVPQYYPIFWGLITNVADSYSGGEHTVSIQCADILKWWDLCKMNVNAAFTAPSGQQGRNIFGNVFFGTNPYDVIWSLAQASFGDIVVGTGSLISTYKEKEQQTTFNYALSDMMLYWQKRFKRVRSNLMLYGTNGVAVRGDTIAAQYPRGANQAPRAASAAVQLGNGGANSGQMTFDVTSDQVTAFRTQFQNAGQVNFWQSEYQSKLELANAAKESIGFEFFMDVTGDLVFKPPFYNLDIISNKPLSWIQDIDIIDWNFDDSEDGVVTQLTLQGSFGGNVEYGFSEDTIPFTSVTDYHLLRKYGWRSETYNSEFLGDPQVMFYHGLDVLDRKNSHRFKGTVTIPMRPELRLGFPVYIAPKDEIWYVTGISHNLAFGGRATTALTLTAKRRKFTAPVGIGKLKFTGPAKGAKLQTNAGFAAYPYSAKTLSTSAKFELTLGLAASIPPDTDVTADPNPYAPLILRHPKTGRQVGYPNVTMVYTRPFNPPKDKLRLPLGQKAPTAHMNRNPNLKNEMEANAAASDAYNQQFVADNTDELREKHSNSRYQYGLNSAGVYVYAYESEKVIAELVILPTANVDVKNPPANTPKFFTGSSGMIRPVSDERGFEVIGHYRYGRGISLRDGNLVISKGKVNQPVNLNTQLALGGDLLSTLNAQSQGIVAITSTYANPADAIARLQPEDTQTAGIASSDGSSPQFTSTASNFVDNAPLGSPEQKGVPASVEASQLSMALTLAEMHVKEQDSQPDPSCVCITGRSDLAFINVGYQLQTNINPATPAPGIFESPSASGTLASPLTVSGNSNIVNFVNDAARNGQPVGASVGITPAGSDVSDRVETFLVRLYQALDPPHKALENVLRGGNLPLSPTESAGDASGPLTQQFGDLAPPFSTPNRAALGGPNGIQGQVDSATRSITNTWKSFGQNLQNQTKRTQLTQQIANEQGDIARLNSELQSLKQGLATGTAHTQVGNQTAQQRIDSINAQLAKLQQQLLNDQNQLQQLPTSATG